MNGYKFHTKDQSKGMQTYNSGVCVKSESDDISAYWYGVLEEIHEYYFTNDPNKKVILFKYDWYDPLMFTHISVIFMSFMCIITIFFG